MKIQSYLYGLSLGVLVAAAIAAGPGNSPPANSPLSAAPTAADKPPTSADLGGATRYLTALATDKPIYRANERLYARAVLLEAAAHQPLADDQQVSALVQVMGPKGDIVSSARAISENSVVAYNWTVPDSAAGGEYTLKISFPATGYAPAQRKFDVRAYRAPRLRNHITFVREGYGPGDKVLASLHSERAEGGLPAGAEVAVTARVDDNPVFTTAATIDAKGDCTASFELPKSIERGEGTLAFVVQDGGTVETASKTIPILLQTLDLAFFPEGGDAVAGLNNRYYVEAKTPAQKPADFAGVILDSKGRQVAEVKTAHEGRGRFDLVPQPGETYTLKLTEPAGITRTFALPAAKPAGVVIHTLADIAEKNKPIRIQLAATDAGDYKVTLTRHELDVAEPITVNLKPGATGIAEFTPKPGMNAGGVLIATVWNSPGAPLAERLIYLQPAHSLNVTVKPDQTAYTPGGKATLNITTTDENGKPVSAVVGLTVTDDTVLQMIDKREQAPRLPVMVLLEPEVEELADAHVYLDPANPEAPLATDLLLGTQGWRRFALVNREAFLAKNGDDALRALAFRKPPQIERRAMLLDGGDVGNVPVAAAWRENAAAEKHAVAADFAKAELKAGLADQLAKAPAQFDFKQMKDLDAPADKLMQGKVMHFRARPQMDDPEQMVSIREYAHALRPNWSPVDRQDFAETLYWNAGIKTDSTGHASASFNMSDSVTTFSINADTFSKTGALGASTTTIQSVQPFYIEPKLPLEVTAGDTIELPVTGINNTSAALQNFNVTINAKDGLTIKPPAEPAADLPPSARIRKIYTIVAGNTPGDFDLTVNATAGQFSDHVTRKLRVKPRGFPTQIAFGGMLKPDATVSRELVIPASLVANSMETSITVYPSPLANLTDAVTALLREPCGCFEQTSSSNYPLAMAEQYFTTHSGVDPKLIAHGNELLVKGYQHLIGFECKDKGYEWFGGAAPGHEALTAYGLMEFRDMQKAHTDGIDDKMIERTRTWLLSRRDGKGGFDRNQKSCDSFGSAPSETTNAYIVWSLLESGEKNLDKEIAAAKNNAAKSDDSYVIALAANICELTKDTAAAHKFMDKLAHLQGKQGRIEGGLTSITRSGGDALAIETTALASIAFNRDPAYAPNAQLAVQSLADSCKAGRFGSTQSTILALKAITAYDQSQARPTAPGDVELLIDETLVGKPIHFDPSMNEPIRFPDVAANLTPGKHTVALHMIGGSPMPFSIAANFSSLAPATDKACKLELTTALKDNQLPEGAITEDRVHVSNVTDQDAPTPVAIIGIPGGLEVRHDQLKELVKAGTIDAYEVNGREVVLYWREIKAHAKLDFPLSLIAEIPGTYSAPASRTYEYYTDESKFWTNGETVTIRHK